MRKFTIFCIVILSLSIFSWLTACDWILSGNAKAAVLEFSEPATDNLLVGLTAGDYTIFSRDFDSSLPKHFPATDFVDWKQEADNKIGN